MKKKKLKVFGVIFLFCLLGGIFGYSLYKEKTQKISIKDLEGVWVEKTKEERHCVIYIHDGIMDYHSYEDEKERDCSYNRHMACSMEKFPDNSTQPISWSAKCDNARSRSVSSNAEDYYYKFEYKHWKLYQKVMAGSPREFVRDSKENHPHIVNLAESLDRSYEASQTALPLEVDKLYCFNRVGADEDSYDSFICAEITNPNPFVIKHGHAKLTWKDDSENVYAGTFFIPANSKMIYVDSMSSNGKELHGNASADVGCEITYDKYDLSFEEEKPLAEVVDSQVVKDETTGKVKEILVNVKTDYPPEPFTEKGDELYVYYELYAVFYKQDEIVGVAKGSGDLGSLDEPDVMSYVSDISDYDRYEVYITRFGYPYGIHE